MGDLLLYTAIIIRVRKFGEFLISTPRASKDVCVLKVIIRQLNLELNQSDLEQLRSSHFDRSSKTNTKST